ncbi:ABC-three component system protein [Shinella sp. NM-101]|uniref:ABC-three component system protein n=1 Tax=Shinella sp. NM-101 TaxID=2744455 RepID=UPI001F245354
MSKSTSKSTLTALPTPSPWPGANARLLGVGAGLPVSKLDRLAAFDDKEFERLVLEWGNDYLKTKMPGVFEVQLRGGAGDKGRDVVVWFDPPGSPRRRWHLYQCKHYATALGTGTAFEEIGKVLYYTHIGNYTSPEEYWFVTHKGVTSPLQDLLDDPSAMRAEILKNWATHCRTKITSTTAIELTADLRAHIESFDFGIFRAKQPLDLIAEHEKTRYHLTVFGAPLILRAPAKAPPSTVAPQETGYVAQMLDAIGRKLGVKVTDTASFAHDPYLKRLFDRSRLTFYSAEGLKELARDQMADMAYFDTLLDEFCDGLYHHYTDPDRLGLDRIVDTVKASQALQLSAHVLTPHVVPNDREGMCHQMANEKRVDWCAR